MKTQKSINHVVHYSLVVQQVLAERDVKLLEIAVDHKVKNFNIGSFCAVFVAMDISHIYIIITKRSNLQLYL